MAGGTDEMRHMAQKVWSVLDRLAESSPDEYQKFVSQAMEEGKEYLDPPQPVMCLCTGVRGVSVVETGGLAGQLCYCLPGEGGYIFSFLHSPTPSFSHSIDYATELLRQYHYSFESLSQCHNTTGGFR